MDRRRRSQLRECLRAVDWSELAARHGTPLLVLDPNRVTAQLDQMRHHLPGVAVRYAVKALPHPAVLERVVAAGAGFDVATNAEVDLAAAAGVAMDRVIHTHPVKKVADIVHAYTAGVRTFVVENACEADKFASLPGDIRILVRLAFANSSAKSDLSTKFGVPPAEAELLVKHVLTAGVHFAGFSFHVGSQTASAAPYRRALTGTLEVIAHLKATLGVDTEVLDIGGGFPVSYRDPMPGLAQVGAIVRDVLGPNPPFTVLAEPGRFVSAPAMTLLTSVVGTAARGGRVWHYLDDGLYGSYSNVLTEDVHPPVLAVKELTQQGELHPVTLAGPTCDSVDVIARDYPMPPLSVGDVLVSPMMGAYTAVTASRFNGIPATPILVQTLGE